RGPHDGGRPPPPMPADAGDLSSRRAGNGCERGDAPAHSAAATCVRPEGERDQDAVRRVLRLRPRRRNDMSGNFVSADATDPSAAEAPRDQSPLAWIAGMGWRR